MGKRMSDLRPKQKNWQLTNYTRTHQYGSKGFRSTRRLERGLATRNPTKRRPWILICWCMLKIRFRIPGIQSYSRRHNKSYHWHYDKTCLFTYINDNWQRVSFCPKCDTRNRYHTPTCNQEACTNSRSPKKNACQNTDVTGNVFRGFSQTMEKYSPLAFLNCNTRYHRNFGCEPNRKFLRGLPYNILHRNLGLKLTTQPI